MALHSLLLMVSQKVGLYPVLIDMISNYSLPCDCRLHPSLHKYCTTCLCPHCPEKQCKCASIYCCGLLKQDCTLNQCKECKIPLFFCLDHLDIRICGCRFICDGCCYNDPRYFCQHCKSRLHCVAIRCEHPFCRDYALCRLCVETCEKCYSTYCEKYNFTHDCQRKRKHSSNEIDTDENNEL
jgi:hypothetical protein